MNSKVIGALVVIVIVLIGLLFYFYNPSESQKLQKLDALYKEGEAAQNLFVRQKNFNQALETYLQLDTRYHPIDGNGKLYFDTANSFFQLQNYSWAIFYYYQAQALAPREGSIQRNLNVALQKAKVTSNPEPSLLTQILGWNTFLSQPEKFQIFTILAFILFLLFSIRLWKPTYKVTWMIWTVCSLLIICTGSLLYSRYLAPIEAVLVKPAFLYRDAGTQYAKVDPTPTLGGTKVEVLNVLQDGQWLWIRIPNGSMGYVERNAIRIIQ